MNLMPQIGIANSYDYGPPPFQDSQSQRRHTIVDPYRHPRFQQYDGSGSMRSGINEIALLDLDKGHGHRRTASNATEKLGLNVLNLLSPQSINNNNSPCLDDEGVEREPFMLTTKDLLHPNDEDFDRASSYGRSILENLPMHHDCSLEGCERVVINISGLKFETQIRTLERLPHTLLGDPEKRKKYWDEERKEFFFDRHRPTFQAILYYYQSGGRLKKPLEVPMDIFVNELHFYELGQAVINCFKENEGYIMEEPIMEVPEQQWQQVIWKTLEYPESSFLAKVYAVFSIVLILVSVVVFCLETLPELEDLGCQNATIVDENGEMSEVSVNNWLNPLFLIESVCIAFFVIELALRFIASPSRWQFIKVPANWIDLLAITPYFVFLGINAASETCGGKTKGSFLSVLRVLRVVRILKLSKHSQGLKILGKTLQTSIRELSMFILFLGIATIIFAGAIFYAEMGQTKSMFTSIPDAFWWAIVTMTTVGYGDYVPVGMFGKMLGGLCVLSGVLAIALPVPVIVANFNNFYRHYTGRRGKGEPMEKVTLQ